jgi:hypothetical protein
MKIIEFSNEEKEIMKKIPEKVMICILLTILSTFLLSYFEISDWAIEFRKVISILLIVLGYILPLIYLTKYLFTKEVA